MNLGADFQAWQTHFQPEEMGRVHGEKGLPDVDDAQSDWEVRVREASGASIQQIKRSFHQLERDLSPQFDHVRSSYTHNKKAYLDRCSALGRDISIPINQQWNWILTTVLIVSASFFSVLLMSSVIGEQILAIFSGIFLVAGFSVISYLGGVVLRQSPSFWRRIAAVAVLIGIAAFLLWVGLYDSHNEQGIRLVILAVASAMIIAVAIPVVAALTRDADIHLERSWRKYRENLKLAAELKSKREENQRQSHAAAQQIVHIGRKIIRVYRDSNSRYRQENGFKEPPYFNEDPDIPDITESEFALDDSNEYEAGA